MKRFLTPIALSIALALCLGSPAVLAAGKKSKSTPEHKAAVTKCNDEYKAAVKEAKTKKGKDRKDALAAAKNTHKECLAAAPK